MGSVALAALLQAVLSLGNVLNSGTACGDAAAFKLASLLQLAAVKADDKKTSFLQYVLVKLCQEGESPAGFLADQMPHPAKQESSAKDHILICFVSYLSQVSQAPSTKTSWDCVDCGIMPFKCCVP